MPSFLQLAKEGLFDGVSNKKEGLGFLWGKQRKSEKARLTLERMAKRVEAFQSVSPHPCNLTMLWPSHGKTGRNLSARFALRSHVKRAFRFFLLTPQQNELDIQLDKMCSGVLVIYSPCNHSFRTCRKSSNSTLDGDIAGHMQSHIS